MRILIVCSGNAPNFDFQKHQAFIYDQVEAVKKIDSRIQFDFFFINRKGALGYLRCLEELRVFIAERPFDCIHAHFVTSALLANLQKRVPVLATFHGSDINLRQNRPMSAIVEILSRRTVYVSESLRKKALMQIRSKNIVIPCGVNFDLFVPRDKTEARNILGLIPSQKYVLFSSSFDNSIKNYSLAKAAVDLLNDANIKVLELKNYTREQVAQLMVAVDVALMTSHSEGSPQFVKEALACNCPVVSTNVGDVREVIKDIEGCYLTTYEPSDIADKLKRILYTPQQIYSRDKIRHLDNCLIAQQLIDLYNKVLRRNGTR